MDKLPIFKDYIKIYISIFINNLILFTFIVTDTFFVSHLGENQIAGLGLMATFITFVAVIFESMSAAVSVRVSKAYGGKLKERVNIKIFSGMIIILSISFVFLLFFHIFDEYMFLIFSAPVEILQYTKEYYYIWFYIVPIVSLTHYSNNLLNNLNYHKINTYITTKGIAINIVLDYILIFGVEGVIPALGVEGAALATVITYVYLSFAKTFYLYKKGYIKYYSYYTKKLKTITIEHIKLILHFLSAGISYPLSVVVMNSIISQYSSEVITAYSLVNSLKMTVYSITASSAITLMILTSRYKGTKEYSKIIYILKLSLYMVTLWSVVIMVFAYFFPSLIGEMFLTTDSSLIMFNNMWWVMLISTTTWALSSNIHKFFNAIGKAKYASIISLSGNILTFTLPMLASYYYGYMAFLWSISIIGIFIMIITLITLKLKWKLIL